MMRSTGGAYLPFRRICIFSEAFFQTGRWDFLTHDEMIFGEIR
jgi:hypothetical protein